MNNLDKRRNLFAQFSSLLVGMDNRQIKSLIKNVRKPKNGWGSNGVTNLAGRKVFVKRVPLTEKEF